MVTTKLVTAEDLAAMGSDAPYELIEGKLHEVSPSFIAPSMISQTLSSWLGPFVRERRLGMLTGEEGGYLLRRNPDTVVAPDLAFVGRRRIPTNHDFQSFFPGPPDLAVEVVSISDTSADVLRKLALYAAAETPLVWVVYPTQRAVTVQIPGEPFRTLGEGDLLTGGEVIPGFEIVVSELFRLPNEE